MAIVNAEKLVCSSGHVNVIIFSRCPFLVHEGINSIISRGTLYETVHDLKEGLPQVWGAFLRCRHAFLDVLSGIVPAETNTCKSSQCPTVCKTGHIPDLSHELGAKSWTNTVHCYNDGIFWQPGSCFPIFCRRDSTVAEAVFSIAITCRMSIFVLSSFGNTAIRSQDA